MSIRTLLNTYFNLKKVLTVVVILFFLFIANIYIAHIKIVQSQFGFTLEDTSIFSQEGILGDGSDNSLSSLFTLGSDDLDDTGDILFLSYVSPPDSLIGTQVSILGGGFTALNNKIYFGNVVINNKESVSEVEIVFTVPDVSYGRNAVYVVNNNGTSNGVYLNVLDPEKEIPVILNVTPAVAKAGDTVTITGSGFTSNSNTIYTGGMTFENVPSSDGTTLTFIMESLLDSDELKTITGTEAEEALKDEFTEDIPLIEFEPLWVYVENEGGLSNYGSFNREFEDHDDMMDMM